MVTSRRHVGELPLGRFGQCKSHPGLDRRDQLPAYGGPVDTYPTGLIVTGGYVDELPVRWIPRPIPQVLPQHPIDLSVRIPHVWNTPADT